MFKKKFVALVLLLVFIGVGVTACGNKKEEETNSSGTRIYKAENGDIEIPAHPTSVVADYYVGDILALGGHLKGADLTYTSPAWEDYLDGVTNIGQSTEKIASLNPDLIITMNQDKVEQYSKLAPTVYIPYGKYNEEEIVTVLGEVLDHESRAEEILAEFNEQVNDLKKELNGNLKSKTYSIFEGRENGDAYIYGNKFGRLGYVIYDKLGLKGTKKAEETILKNDDSWAQLTGENVKQFAGDVILLSIPTNVEIKSGVLVSNEFKSTDAYKKGNVFAVDADLFYHTDMLSMEAQMDAFAEILEDVK